MKLEIYTRAHAESLPGRPDWAVIAMAPKVSLQSGWRASHFANLDHEMSHEYAFAIVKFMRLNALKVNGFMVIGDRDIARTQGVAAWLSEKCYIPQFALTKTDAEFALDPEFNQRALEALCTPTF